MLLYILYFLLKIINTTTLNTTTPIQIGISVRNSVINTVDKSVVKTKELLQENNA